MGAIGRLLSPDSSNCWQPPVALMVLQPFLTSFDTCFHGWLSCANSPAADGMSTHQAANIALALSRLPPACGAVAPSPATLEALAQHTQHHLVQHTAHSLSSLLRFYAAKVSNGGITLGCVVACLEPLASCGN